MSDTTESSTGRQDISTPLIGTSNDGTDLSAGDRNTNIAVTLTKASNDTATRILRRVSIVIIGGLAVATLCFFCPGIAALAAVRP